MTPTTPAHSCLACGELIEGDVEYERGDRAFCDSDCLDNFSDAAVRLTPRLAAVFADAIHYRTDDLEQMPAGDPDGHALAAKLRGYVDDAAELHDTADDACLWGAINDARGALTSWSERATVHSTEDAR